MHFNVSTPSGATRLKIRSALLNVMFDATMKAAKGLIRDFGEVEHLQVSKKGPGDFVSRADLRAEKIIKETLEKARPGSSFLLEESGEVEGDLAGLRFIVDPLDGTLNFLHGVPHFAISIACEKEGQLIAGMTYDPIKDELFYAERGQGAFMNDRRLRVSGRDHLTDTLLGVTFPRPGYAGPYNTFEIAKEMNTQVASLRRTGSAVLDICYVAAGRFDGYWAAQLSPWDMAAAALIVYEAGGYVSALNGKTDFLEQGNILCGNERVHKSLLKFF